MNILSLLTAQPNANPRTEFYYYFGRGLEGVRKDNWKLVLPHKYRSYEGLMPGNDGIQGDTKNKEAEYALFDMRRDAGERYDVKEIYPEVVEELKRIAERARKDLGDDNVKMKGENVREPGKITNKS